MRTNNLEVMNLLTKVENIDNEQTERQRAGKWVVQNAKWNELIKDLEARREQQTDTIMTPKDIVDVILNKEGTIMGQACTMQLCQRLNIPPSFFLKLEPDTQERVLKQFVNEYKGGNLLVRKERRDVHGNEYEVFRGIVSDKYSIIDTVDVLKALDGKFGDELRLKSLVKTDSRFAMEIIIGSSPLSLGLTENKERDAFYPVIGISNSEIGKGSLNFTAALFNEWCANGAMRKFEDWGNEQVRHIYTDINSVLGAIRNIETRAIVDASNEILMTYDKARGIFIPDSLKFTEEVAEKLDFGKKGTERAVNNKSHKYAGDNLFEVVGALTNAIHEATGSVEVRENLELKTQEWLENEIEVRANSMALAVINK